MDVVVLGGGATHALVRAIAPELQAVSGARVTGSFGAVGAMRDRLLAGERVDVLALTRSMIDELERAGHVVAGSARDIGVVATSVAVRAGDPLPEVATVAGLRAALLQADALYIPDTHRSTAGIHVAGMLQRLGIAEAMAGRLREYPNGATAMAALAAATTLRPLGCTQRTEIVATSGITLVQDLPAEVGLATVYTAAVATRATDAAVAAGLVDLLTRAATQVERARAGFDEIG